MEHIIQRLSLNIKHMKKTLYALIAIFAYVGAFAQANPNQADIDLPEVYRETEWLLRPFTLSKERTRQS